MSVAICSRSSSTVSFPLEKKEVLLGSILMPTAPFAAAACGDRVAAAKEAVMINNNNVDKNPPPPPPGELIDIWTSIQARKAKQQPNLDEPSYVHPLTRRSSSLMSQKSLEICTESLGSETGSEDYFSSSAEDNIDMDSPHRPMKKQIVILQQNEENDQEEDVHAGVKKSKDKDAAVNYHCCSISSSGRRCAPSGRAFPPPLPSISCRDGPCVQMRPHRKDGRLVVEAVAVPSQNYLHAQRQGGRLLLSFIDTTTTTPNKNIVNTTYNLTPPEQTQEQEQDDAELMELEEQEVEEEEEEEEEEVEVVDRGTMVEVKVSSQPQQQSGSGGSAAMKVHRSSIVINKFVSCSQDQDKENSINSSDDNHAMSTTTASGPRRLTACSTTTAAAAAVAASSLSTLPADGDEARGFDNKLLFTSKRRNSREELLRDMRRCSQFRKPLFIWETCCIAT